jgi:hypothetical protein
MISIFSDTKKLEYALARLADAAKVDLGLVIKQEGAYVARTIMLITPPTGDKLAKGSQTQIPIVTGGTITKTKAGGLSTNARKQGENAILGDLFGGRQLAKEKSIGIFQKIGNSTEVPPRDGQNETMGVNLGWEGSKKIRIYRKFWQPGASIAQMRAFHYANRNERGRPKQVTRSAIGRWQVQDQMWVSNEATLISNTRRKRSVSRRLDLLRLQWRAAFACRLGFVGTWQRPEPRKCSSGRILS